MELEPYKDALEFISEHQLTSEPQRVDLVIIMKEPGTVIDKNIARKFKRVNILEYKSPEDTVSVWDFYKALGYAAQYAWQNKTDPEDMTVSLVVTRHPRELLKHIAKNKRYTAAEDSPGIYRITGAGGHTVARDQKTRDGRKPVAERAEQRLECGDSREYNRGEPGEVRA
ncbi:MAG: hypothetical protein LBK66_04920 [Spirochaetaceae bacterium]|nr:hypothetical protein [Spirochaetaceae bacterium]